MNDELTRVARVGVRGDGKDLLRAMLGGVSLLERNAGAVNALNVFPVPDGDTGTNMLLTMQAAVRETSTVSTVSAGVVAHAAAQGALMGARGNSGVILSQILRGLARSLDGLREFGGLELAEALRQGSATAYKGVIKPVEGTILTVIREASDAAVLAAQQRDDIVGVLETAVAAANESVQRTPLLLEVLRDNGVVDAGGQGLYIIMEGWLRALRGEEIEGSVADITGMAVRLRMPSDNGGMEYGYCTEFLLRGRVLPVDFLKSDIALRGDSVLVVGDPDVLKVHVHTFDPGAILSLAVKHGTLSNIKIENMQEQHAAFRGATQAESALPGTLPAVAPKANGRVATIAVVVGDGLTQVFTSLGVSLIVPGGQTMNPSIEELLQAIELVPNEDVILLPNNKNIVLAARQAASMSTKRVFVVPSETIPQGIAALLAYNHEVDMDSNSESMMSTLPLVQTAEVTTAVRSARINGLDVEEGQIIGLANGKLVAVGLEIEDVVLRVLDNLDADRSEIVTLYYGQCMTRESAEVLAGHVRAKFPDQGLEVVGGGQPHYDLIISVE